MPRFTTSTTFTVGIEVNADNEGEAKAHAQAVIDDLARLVNQSAWPVWTSAGSPDPLQEHR